MTDYCEVLLCGAAEREIRQLTKKDKVLSVRLQNVIKNVRQYSWQDCVKLELIKVLDENQQIGEIRLMGKGGRRLIFFWDDVNGVRNLHVTAIPAKNVLSNVRLNTYIAAAAVRRQQYLNTGEC